MTYRTLYNITRTLINKVDGSRYYFFMTCCMIFGCSGHDGLSAKDSLSHDCKSKRWDDYIPTSCASAV